jgi:predicted transcriptional regulator
MAMSVRFTEEQTERLRRQAEAEHRSMQAVVFDALDEYVERREHKVHLRRVLDRVLSEDQKILWRLGHE